MRGSEILQQLRDAAGETQIAVVEVTNQPRVLVNFGDDRGEAIERLQGVAASHQRGSYLAAFRMADRLLQQSLGKERRIILLGDSQDNQWSEGKNSPPFLQNVTVTLPEYPPVESHNVALCRTTRQLGISWATLLREVVGHTLSSRASRAACGWFIASMERRWRERDVSLDGQPETVTLQAEWEADPREWVAGQIGVERFAGRTSR